MCFVVFDRFFVHTGDVLVKNGEPELAVAMYQNARFSLSFRRWPFQETLAERIAAAEARALRFEREGEGDMMVNSTISCTGCHQR